MGDRVTNVGAVVLAGGKSRRMGRDKRFLELEGRPLLDRVLATLDEVFADVVLSVAQEEAELSVFGRPTVADVVPGAAALGGIYSGLLLSSAPRVFVSACDMPLLSADLIRYLVGIDADADLVIPRLLTGYQPAHAVYGKGCLPVLEGMIREGRLKAQDLVDARVLTVRVVGEDMLRTRDPQLLSFMNLNTPSDLEFARKVLAGSSPR